MIPDPTVYEHDRVRVIGRCMSCSTREQRGRSVSERPLLTITGVVGTISPASDSDPAVIKVWPDNSDMDPDGCGRMWFFWDHIESVEKLNEPEQEIENVPTDS